MQTLQLRSIFPLLLVSVLAISSADCQQPANLQADRAVYQGSADLSYSDSLEQSSGAASGGRLASSAVVNPNRTLNSSPFLYRAPASSQEVFGERSMRVESAKTSLPQQTSPNANAGFSPTLQNQAQQGRLGPVIHVSGPSLPLHLGASPAISGPLGSLAPYSPYPTALQPGTKPAYKPGQYPAVHP